MRFDAINRLTELHRALGLTGRVQQTPQGAFVLVQPLAGNETDATAALRRLAQPEDAAVKSFKQQAEEAADFCKDATDKQLPKIYQDETDRAERHNHEGDIADNAAAFAAAAKAELERRNLWPID